MSRLLVLIVVFIWFPAKVLFAQSPEIAKRIASVKADQSNIFVEVSGPEAAGLTSNIRSQLIDNVRLRFRAIESALESAIPGADEAAAKTAQLKADLKINVIEWTVAGKKKKNPVTYFALAYVDQKEGRRFVIDRALVVVKDPKKYKWGEGFGKDATAALSSSKENLIGQISQTVETSTISSTVESGGAVSESFQSRTSAFSKMTLQGITSSSPVEIDRDYFVVSWITLEDLEKSFAPVKARVLTAAAEGEKYEEIGNVQAALQNYYKAYVYADGFYSSLPYQFKGSKEPLPDIRAGLKAKIEQVLGTMNITMKPAYEISDELIFVPFDVRYKNQRVGGVVFETMINNSAISEKIRGGRGRLELSSFEPSEKTEVFDVKFGVDISEDLQRDEELQLLEPGVRIRLIRNLEADFSNIFQVNITASFDGPDVFFQAKTKNIAALAGKWSFGDGQESFELNPKHKYATNGVFEVQLTLNGDSTLKDVKYVYLNEQVLRKSKVEEIAAASTILLNTPVQPELVSDTVKAAIPIIIADSGKTVSAERPAAPDTVKALPPKVLTVSEILAAQKSPEKIKDVYEEIRFIEVTDQLMRVLNRKKGAGEFLVGKQTDLLDSEGAMVIIADKKMVVDKLVFSGNRFMSILSGKEVTDLKNQFPGKAMIWVQAVKK